VFLEDEMLLPQPVGAFTAWTLRIPLIERVRDAVWAAVMRLKGGDQPPAA
jgi:hypothetical protein